MRLPQLLLAALACALCLGASAQWRWLDGNGRQVFSDRPPPPEVPEKNILRRAGVRGPAYETSAPPGASATSAAMPSPGATAPSQGDKALVEKKKEVEKQASDVQAAQRRADEEKVARLKADSCARARQAKAGLDAGGRMARTNAEGEREFLDDAGRDEESARIQSVIDADCR